MLQEDYRVRLDAFQGPLDLLLYLIRRLEVDITDIPVAEVTDQYLAFLRQVDDVDVEMAGEFLVMAATLIELKSRTLMPPEERPATEDGDGSKSRREEVDPGLALVQSLLAYQRFRNAGECLEGRRVEFSQRFPSRAGRRARGRVEEEVVEIELEDAHVMDLSEAYERIMASIDFDRLGDHVVEMDDTPIALHAEDLLDRLRRAPVHTLTLQDAFEGHTRIQRVGLFLATLELARTHKVTVRQEDIEREIELVLVDDEDSER